ncbi:MAG: TRAP transporter small permease subunit [Gammaproteobacteria bacterium]
MMQRSIRLLESLSEYSGRLFAWLTLFMVLLTFLVVVLRYAFNLGWIGMQEAITYLHAITFMMGAAYTLKHDGHVRVDIFYRRWGNRGRARVDFFGGLLLLMPVCLFIAGSSWSYVLTSWSYLEGSPESGGLPWIYLLKTCMLLMPALLILQGLAQILSAWRRLRGDIPIREDDQGVEL